MSQLVCCDGFVHAEYDDSLTVDLASAPNGNIIIPWNTVAARALPVSDPAPDLTAEEMESDEKRAAHVKANRYADTRIAPVPTAPDELRAYAASARYYRSIAGLTIGKASYATDQDAADRIAAKAARTDDKVNLTWKSASGFVSLTGSDLKAISAEIDAYRDACFSAEAKADADIADGSVKAMADIDAIIGAVKA